MERQAMLVDRDDFTLVLIDIQNRLAAVMDRRDEVIRNSKRLARTAKLMGAPIVLTRQYPKGLGETVPELEETLGLLETEGAELRRIDKMAFCCSREPDFLQAVEDLARRQVVLAGMETHICIAQTALNLLERDREIFVAADACCSRRTWDHELALDRLRAAGVGVLTSESVMYEAAGVAGTEEFRALLKVVKGEA